MPTAGDCSPSENVATLQVHGTADATVPIGGGTFGGPRFLSAQDTIQGWADRGSCAAGTEAAALRDYDDATGGDDTTVTTFAQGGGAELWVVEGASHVFQGTPAFFPPSSTS